MTYYAIELLTTKKTCYKDRRYYSAGVLNWDSTPLLPTLFRLRDDALYAANYFARLKKDRLRVVPVTVGD